MRLPVQDVKTPEQIPEDTRLARVDFLGTLASGC